MIRYLYAQGLNITEISNKTGFDRKTVRKYLKLRTIPEPRKEQKEIANSITTKITSITIVSDFVTKVRPERGVPATLRYETKPGVQAQVDILKRYSTII